MPTASSPSDADTRLAPTNNRDVGGDVVAVHGHNGALAGYVSAAEWAGRGAVVTLTLADGRHVFVERDRLEAADGGRLSFGHVPAATPAAIPAPAVAPQAAVSTAIRYEGRDRPADGTLAEGERAVIPVVEEQAVVQKRSVKRAVVRVHRHVREQEKKIDVPLTVEEVRVERVPSDRVVDEMEPPRNEGDTTIIPVYEEVLVVQRKFRVKEEIHLTRVRTQRPSTHTVTLRRHEVEVERVALPEKRD